MEFPVTIDMYVAVVGFFLPIIISVVNKSTWSTYVKYGVSLGMVIIATAGHLIFSGQWDVANIPGNILKMLYMTIGSYLVFWRPSGISDYIEKKVNG